jgi:predicted nucleotidyltransferase
MNESGVFRYLNELVKSHVLLEKKEGNLRKFEINKFEIPNIFPIYDQEKFESLPLLRKNAINFYLKKSDKKPVFLILFGSTAKGTFKKDSDLDILEVVNEKFDEVKAKKFAEAQTGIKVQVFQLLLDDFIDELKLKNDKVVQSAIETGFPIFNNKFYYEVVYG